MVFFVQNYPPPFPVEKQKKKKKEKKKRAPPFLKSWIRHWTPCIDFSCCVTSGEILIRHVRSNLAHV